jgi:hypothetical protein
LDDRNEIIARKPTIARFNFLAIIEQYEKTTAPIAKK